MPLLIVPCPLRSVASVVLVSTLPTFTRQLPRAWPVSTGVCTTTRCNISPATFFEKLSASSSTLKPKLIGGFFHVIHKPSIDKQRHYPQESQQYSQPCKVCR